MWREGWGAVTERYGHWEAGWGATMALLLNFVVEMEGKWGSETQADRECRRF